MRGKGHQNAVCEAVRRITPAYAGKREPLVSIPVQPQGSPPPMRGKGNLWCRYQYNHRDHPRLCGEKMKALESYSSRLGSPPPMRGKEFLWIMPTPVFRITPAYAGKRKERTGSITQSMDHPRLCGEKRNCDMNRLLFRGSPPPMRGKALYRIVKNCFNGITPAYAGKRASERRLRSCPQDHPRLCGEKFVLFVVKRIISRITPAYAGKSTSQSTTPCTG